VDDGRSRRRTLSGVRRELPWRRRSHHLQLAPSDRSHRDLLSRAQRHPVANRPVALATSRVWASARSARPTTAVARSGPGAAPAAVAGVLRTLDLSAAAERHRLRRLGPSSPSLSRAKRVSRRTRVVHRGFRDRAVRDLSPRSRLPTNRV
jgi:hypothetical protein